MATHKTNKPTSPGMRFLEYAGFEEITREKPEKGLLARNKKTGGRNSYGRVTALHKGGGSRRHYRIIDFKRNKSGIPARVAAIEYDPNRTARLALLHYVDGEKRYILWPVNLKVGDTVMAGPGADIKPGNAMPLANIPLGTLIHNVELRVGRGGQIVRSAGTFAQLVAKEGDYAQVRLPSGEVRMVLTRCMATVGQIGNVENENLALGKAGRSRWLGRRPRVRGVAMNPVDHPMGGGEGKSSGGRHPCSPWGMPSKGFKTRKRKPSDRLIVKKR